MRETVTLIGADIAYRCVYEHKPRTWMTGLRMLRHPGVACVIRFRLQCFFYDNHLAALGWLCKSTNSFFYGVEIDERAQIAGGLLLGHAVTILVTGNVQIGERCVLLHQNTLGLAPFGQRSIPPGIVIVGDNVTFGGGSCAYGEIVIGDKCRIGVNSVVNHSCPVGSSLFGVPARVVGNQGTIGSP
jgi:serine O-acetyltransferase